jgi:hypothetical protein
MKNKKRLLSHKEILPVDSNSGTALTIRFVKECISERSWTSKNLSIAVTSLRHLLAFAVLLSGFTSLACFGQTVTVRIINAGNGKPVAAHKILVSGIRGSSETPDEARRKLAAKHPSPDLTLLTDAQGRVQFDLPNAPPADFYVRAVLRSPVWDCSCLITVPTEKLMRKGLWIGPHDDSSVQPQPGEILLRIRPTALWQRVFWPFLVDLSF